MGVSQREKGNMKGCSLLLLLLLHTCAISGFSIERELVVEAPDGKPGGTCGPGKGAGGSNLRKNSPLTGIVDLPSNIEGISSPTDGCLKPFSCKRPSLRNRKKMICCLPVNNRGRTKCPNSCD